MLTFIIRRILHGLLIFAGVILLVFFLFYVVPGDPEAISATQRTEGTSKETLMQQSLTKRNEKMERVPEGHNEQNTFSEERIEKELGLDEPLGMQLLLYLNDLSPLSVHHDHEENQIKYQYNRLFSVGGDKAVVIKMPFMRRSLQTNKKVSEIITENIASTFWLVFATIILSVSLGTGLGIMAALKKNTLGDNLIVAASTVGMSIPSYVAAIFIALIFGYYLSDYTGLSIAGQLWVNHPVHGRQLQPENLVLPVLALAIRPMSVIMRISRCSMLDVLTKDYIITAKAKGLKHKEVIIKHALKNSLTPVVNGVSGWVTTLVAGAFFVEYVFQWGGLGFITLQAAQMLDFPLVMGTVLVVALVIISVNIMADILYVIVDPGTSAGRIGEKEG